MQNIGSAFSIIKNVFVYLFKNPKLLIPEVITTILSLLLFGAVAFLLIDIDNIEIIHIIALISVLIIGSMLNGFAAHAVLLMVKDTHDERKPSLKNALFSTLKKLHHLLPIMLFSVLAKALISLISGILKGSRKRGGRRSVGQTTESVITRSFRMFIFIMLTLEAFEQPKFTQTFSKAKDIIKERFWLFASGVLVIKLASALFAFLPIIILILIIFVLETLNWGIIIGLILYIFFAGAIVLVAEVIYISQLYLWNKAWEEAASKAKANQETVPSIHDIEQPFLLKDVDDNMLYSANDPGDH